MKNFYQSNNFAFKQVLSSKRKNGLTFLSKTAFVLSMMLTSMPNLQAQTNWDDHGTVGNAGYADHGNNVIQMLSVQQTGRAGAAVHELNEPWNPTSGTTFNKCFKVYFGCPGNDNIGSDSKGDGLAFSLWKQGETYNVGGDAGGGGLGYMNTITTGDKKMITIEFDTWSSQGNNQFDANYGGGGAGSTNDEIALQRDGNASDPFRITSVNAGNLEDGKEHDVCITYNPTTHILAVNFDGNLTPLFSYDLTGSPYDLPTYFGNINLNHTWSSGKEGATNAASVSKGASILAQAGAALGVASVSLSNQTVCSGNSATFDAGSTNGPYTYQWSGNSNATSQQIIASVAGNYTVTVLNGLGCSATATGVLTVNSTSAAGTASAASPICTNTSTTVSLSSNTGTIQWQTNASGAFVNIPGATNSTYTTPNLTTTTGYRALVTSGVCPAATSNTATINISPTSVGGTAAAASSPICTGTAATINLTGQTAGATIQWETNASGAFVAIPGANGTSYTTPNLTTATSYRASVKSGACSAINSSTAVVNISPISVGGTASPTASPICTGSSTTINLSGQTAGATIQWETNASGAFVAIPGANGTSYTTPNLTTATSYRASVKSGACSAINSSTAVVNISPISVGGTASPTASPICTGSSTTINLSGQTAGATIQWETNASGAFVAIPGANGTSYNTPNLTTATSYRASVKSGACSAINSSTAVVNISPISVGGTASATASPICTGSSTTINLSGQTAGATIQWETNASGAFVAIPGANGDSYTTPNLTTAASYRASVKSGACSPINSSTAVVNISPISVGGTASPTASPICTGSSTIINLSGQTAGATIQWETNASGAFVAIPGANGTSYTTPNLTTATTYRASVKSGACSPINSSSAVVNISATPSGGTVSAISPICTGNTTTITHSGSPGSIIQWQTDASGSFQDIPGASGVTYVTPALTQPTSYRAKVTSGACPTVPSSTALVSISSVSNGGIASATSYICTGTSTTITLGGGYNGDIQWQSNASGSFLDIPSATNPAYTTPNLTTATTYRAVVTNGACGPKNSNDVAIGISSVSNGGTASATSPICTGSSTTITLGGGYNGDIQWQTNASGSFQDIPGETNPTYTTPNLTSATTYRAVVTSGACGPKNSNDVAIAISSVSNGGTASATSPICIGTSTTITLGGGYNGDIQWQTNASGSFQDIPGETSPTYITPNLTTATTYRAVVTSGACGPKNSNDVAIAISSVSNGGTASAQSPICTGSSTTLTLGGGYNGEIQWQTNASGSFQDIPGETNPTYITPNLTTATTYRAIVTSGACGPKNSNDLAIGISSVSNGGNATAQSPICTGSSTTLTLGGGYNGDIQWQTNASGSFQNIPGETNPTYTTPNLTTATTYRAVVTSGACGPKNSNDVAIAISSVSNGGTVSAQSPICTGSSTTLTLGGGYNGAIKWQTNASGSFQDIPGETKPTYTTPNLIVATTYRAVVTNGACGPKNSTDVAIIVDSKSNPGTITSSPASVCQNSSAAIKLTGNNGTIKWQQSTDQIIWSDMTNTSDSLISDKLKVTTYFRALVTNGVCESDTSLITKVIVNDNSGFISLKDTLICEGTSFKISATSGYSNYHWYDQENGAAGQTYLVTKAAVLIVTAKDAIGCDVSDTMIVNGCNFDTIPNVFTPNKDGINDLFIIRGLVPNSALEIYNRWGSIVYTTKDYENNWDGGDSADGIYYYIYRKNVLPAITRTGFVEIIR